MTYSDRQFATELLAHLTSHYDPLYIAQWADQIFLRGDYQYSQTVREFLIDLFTMQEGEEFVIPADELRSRAEKLILSDSKMESS